MKRSIIFLLSALPWMLMAQPELPRRVISSAGFAGADGSTFTIGEAMTTLGQSGGLQVAATFQQGSAVLDSVWPGDANDDLIANNLDLLAVGLAYGSTGPSRDSLSNAWQAQPAPAWLQGLPTGVNYQHPDCNGDGLINDDDTLAINLNYGFIHQKTGPENDNGLPLRLVFEDDSVATDSIVTLGVYLGNDTLPGVNIYGVAVSIDLDTTLIVASEVEVQFPPSWLGTKGVDLLTLQQPMTVDERIHLAMARTDQVGRNGLGKVANVIIMVDDLSGKTTISEILRVEVSGLTVINAQGADVPTQIVEDSLVVFDNPTSLPPNLAQYIRIYPNPARQHLSLDLGGLLGRQWVIRDLQGRMLRQERGTFAVEQIPLGALAEGSYLMEVETDQGWWRGPFQVLQ